MGVTDVETVGIDTPADLQRADQFRSYPEVKACAKVFRFNSYIYDYK